MSMWRLILAGASTFVLTTACGGAPQGETAGACEGDGIVVTDAWARAARSGQPTSAAYLTVCNGADLDDAITGGSAAGVDAVELHVTLHGDDGVSSMAQTDRITLPKGEAVSLAPGGAHFMLIGLPEGVSSENPPTLVLEFENAPAQEITLDARDAGEMHSH